VAVVISRLDYCNSVLAGMPLVTLTPLEHILNVAARLIFELTASLRVRETITPSILAYIEYKLCCIMRSVHSGRCPTYLKNTVQHAAARQSRYSSTSACLLPRLKTNFGERAFSHAGPFAWNALPTHVREVPNSDSFRKLLKTHF